MRPSFERYSQSNIPSDATGIHTFTIHRHQWLCRKKAFCLLMMTARFYYLAACTYVYKDLRRCLNVTGQYSYKSRTCTSCLNACQEKKKESWKHVASDNFRFSLSPGGNSQRLIISAWLKRIYIYRNSIPLYKQNSFFITQTNIVPCTILARS